MNLVSLPLLCCDVPTRVAKTRTVCNGVCWLLLGREPCSLPVLNWEWVGGGWWWFVVLQWAPWPTGTYAVCCPLCYGAAQRAPSDLSALELLPSVAVS